MTKLCSICGEEFETKYASTKTCSNKCKQESRKRTVKKMNELRSKNGTIDSYRRHKCWKCAKSVNSGCSWSKKLVPVTGWMAEAHHVHDGIRYTVLECPEFIRG